MKYVLFGHYGDLASEKINVSQTSFVGELDVSEGEVTGQLRDQQDLWTIQGRVSGTELTLTKIPSEEHSLLKGETLVFSIEKEDIAGAHRGRICYPEGYPEAFEISGGFAVVSHTKPLPLEFHAIENPSVVYCAISAK